MKRKHTFYRLNSTAPARHLSLAFLLLCGFTSWMASDFHSADATVSSVYLADSNELIAANNSDSLRLRTGLKKTDLTENIRDRDSNNEIEPIWLLLTSDLTRFIAPSSANHHLLPASIARSSVKYLLKAPRAPPLA